MFPYVERKPGFIPGVPKQLVIVTDVLVASRWGVRGGILIPPRFYGYIPLTVVALATRCTASA